jgi:hypothetical protein
MPGPFHGELPADHLWRGQSPASTMRRDEAATASAALPTKKAEVPGQPRPEQAKEPGHRRPAAHITRQALNNAWCGEKEKADVSWNFPARISRFPCAIHIRDKSCISVKNILLVSDRSLYFSNFCLCPF